MAKSKDTIFKADEQEKELATEQSASVAEQEKPKEEEKPLSEHQKFLLCNLTSGNRMSMKDALEIVRKHK